MRCKLLLVSFSVSLHEWFLHFLVNIISCLSDIFIPDLDDDFFDILKEVLPIAAKWRAVGQALRLKVGVLDSIAASHPHKVDNCLSEMLTEWLRKNYNVRRFGEPSWQRLVEVVGDPAGGANPALASQIAEKHRAKRTTGTVHRRHSFSVCGAIAFGRFGKSDETVDV